MRPCKKHQENPVIGYDPCPGCEIEWMRIEIKKLKEVVATYNEFNNLNNDKDAYLYAMGQWALGVDNDKPVKEDFGL